MQPAHVHADATCKDVDISVDAVGRDAEIPVMPNFLDLLIGDLNRLVTSTSISPQAVIRTAESSRVTRHVLEARYPGKKFDTAVVSAAFARAASTGMLSQQHAAIVRAYDALGAATVRRFWLVAGPLFLVFAARSATSDLRYEVVRLLRAPYQVAEYVFYGADAAVAVLPLLVLTFLCGRVARRSVRRSTGSKANRRPKQRPWPEILLLVGAAAHYVPIYEGFATPDAKFFRPSLWPYAPHVPTGRSASLSLAPVRPVGLSHPHHRHPG